MENVDGATRFPRSHKEKRATKLLAGSTEDRTTPKQHCTLTKKLCPIPTQNWTRSNDASPPNFSTNVKSIAIVNSVRHTSMPRTDAVPQETVAPEVFDDNTVFQKTLTLGNIAPSPSERVHTKGCKTLQDKTKNKTSRTIVVVLPLTSVESVVLADRVESVVLAGPVEFSETLSQVIAHGSEKKTCMVPAVMGAMGEESR